MITLVFPGQGAQYAGMGKELYENNEPAKKIFHRANKIAHELGLPKLTELCFEADDILLRQTQFTQPAIYTTSFAAYKAVEPAIYPRIKSRKVQAGGHSVGEYAALAAAGYFTFEQGLQLVSKRANIMSQQRKGTLGAIVGLDQNILYKLFDNEKVWIALNNCPGQYIIGGEEKYVQKVIEDAIEKGANKNLSKILNVSGAFHTPMYNKASQEFRKNDIVGSILEVNPAKAVNYMANGLIRVISNFSGEWYNLSNMQSNLAFQINHPVEWTLCTIKLLDKSSMFIELGPKKTVSGMIKQTAKSLEKEVTLLHVEDMDSLTKTIAALKQ